MSTTGLLQKDQGGPDLTRATVVGMAFVSGGSQTPSGPPQPQPAAFPGYQPSLQQQLQEAILQQQQQAQAQQQHQQQQQQQQEGANMQNPMMQQMLAQLLLAQQAAQQQATAAPPPPQPPPSQQLLMAIQLLQQQQLQQAQAQQAAQAQAQVHQLQQVVAASAGPNIATPTPQMAAPIAQPQPQNANNPLLYYQLAAAQLAREQSQQQQQQQQSASGSSQQQQQPQLLQSIPSTSAFHSTASTSAHDSRPNYPPVNQATVPNPRLLEAVPELVHPSNAPGSQIQQDKSGNQLSELSVQERISRLISDNEAIIQQPQVMIKRRPYHRSTQSSIEMDSASGSTRTSPGSSGVREHHRMPTTRSQSLYEPLQGVKAFGGGNGPSYNGGAAGSITSGQPLSRSDRPATSNHPCQYCQAQFGNLHLMMMHETTCTKKAEMSRPPPASTAPKLEETSRNSDSPVIIADHRHPLKRRLLSAVAEQPHKMSKADIASPAPTDEQFSSQQLPIIPETRKLAPGISTGLSRRATVAALSCETVANTAPSIPIHSIQSYQSLAGNNLQNMQALQAQHLIQQQQQQQIQTQMQKEAAIHQLAVASQQQQQHNQQQQQLQNQQNNPLIAQQLLAQLQQIQQLGQLQPAAPSIQSLLLSLQGGMNGQPQMPQLAVLLAQQQQQQAEVLRQQQQFLSQAAGSASLPGSSTQLPLPQPSALQNQAPPNFLQQLQQQQALQQQEQQRQQQLLQQQTPHMNGGPNVQQSLAQLHLQNGQGQKHLNGLADIKQESGTSSAFRNPDAMKVMPPPVPKATSLGSSAEALRTQLEKPVEALSGDINKPYTLVLASKEPTQVSAQQQEVKEKLSNRHRALASDTYCCLHRLLPSAKEQGPRESSYNSWPKSRGTEVEKNLNKMYLSTCQMTPGTGIKEFFRVTSANREGGQLRVTHSSFWEISTKLRLRQNQNLALITAMNQQGPTNGLYEYGAKRPNQEKLPTAMIVPEMVIGRSAPQPSPQPTQPSPQIAIQPTQPSVSTAIEPPLVHTSPTSPTKPTTSAPSEIPTIVLQKHESIQALEEEAARKSKQPHKPERKESSMNKFSDKKETVIGGHRTDEVYVYIRGRGKGRYICDRCGIRCKKPSMLKKHIRSHSDVRPYQCNQCNFSFKTKGNLTKHLASKSHRKKVAEAGGDMSYASDSEDEDRLEIASNADDEIIDLHLQNNFDEDGHNSSDDEDGYPEVETRLPAYSTLGYGQENILEERATHTPPSRWVLVEETPNSKWPTADIQRRCFSAPPVAALQSSSPIPPADPKEEAPTTLISTLLPPSNPVFLHPMATSLNSEMPVGAALLSVDSSSLYGQFLSKEEHPCTQCGRIFRKQAELTLHQHTHNIERQTAKNRVFQCPDCRQPFRTKPLLVRHMWTAHGVQLPLDAEPLAMGDTTLQSVLANAPTASPRSFLCSDCGIGFRKHGILAKHLRSKTHVVKLEGLGKLPADSLNLIMKKDNGACLTDVDTADCEKARESLLAIVETIRAEFPACDQPMTSEADSQNSENTSDSTTFTTPTDNQITAPSAPVVSSPQASATAISTVTFPLLNPNFLQVAAFAGIAARRPSMSSHGPSPKKRREDPFPSMRPRGDSFSNLPSLEPMHRRRAETFGAVSMRELHTRTISANVWMPPRADSMDRPRVPDAWSKASTPGESTEPGSSRSDDLDSLRSSSSTPVHRPSNGHAPSPLLGPTKCILCEIQFETHVELQVHMHADHISMRDGKDFRCPKKHCDTVYPNRESLRQHLLHLHYQRGMVMLAPDTEESSNPPSPSDGLRDHRSDSISSLVDIKSNVQLSSLPCAVCGDRFVDAMALQDHWLTHVTKRPHICSVCDAGFTTLDALNAHAVTHVMEQANVSF
ncbi:unnamed protein product, partial [Mesorhabditis spiculigera]